MHPRNGFRCYIFSRFPQASTTPCTRKWAREANRQCTQSDGVAVACGCNQRAERRGQSAEEKTTTPRADFCPLPSALSPGLDDARQQFRVVRKESGTHETRRELAPGGLELERAREERQRFIDALHVRQ